MQGTGWIPITPIDVTLPYWAGLWFGIYPTVETIGAQLAAAVFVIGSYFLAQELKVKRPRRRARRVAGRAAGGRGEREPEPRRATAASARGAPASAADSRRPAHGHALARGLADRSVSPWRAATAAIMSASSEPSRSSTSSPRVEGDDRRRARQVVRVAAAVRALVAVADQHDVVAVAELLRISRISKCAASICLDTWLDVFAEVM